MPQWTKTEPPALDENAFALFGDKWVLITAQRGSKINAMTASWGGLGILWNESVATVYVRQSRFTHEFIDAADTFSITVYDESFKPMLSDVMGSLSGRSIDKIAMSGLTPTYLDGTPVFEQARLAFVCEKLYRHTFSEQGFHEKSYAQKYYADGDFHTLYIARVRALYVNHEAKGNV